MENQSQPGQTPEPSAPDSQGSKNNSKATWAEKQQAARYEFSAAITELHEGLSKNVKVEDPGYFSASAPEPKTTERSETLPRTAVFVVHGIGRELRYETLDSVATLLRAQDDAVRKSLNPEDSSRETKIEQVTIGDQPCGLASLTIKNPKATDVDTQVDIYEGYWSPLTKGKVTLSQVATFLMDAGWNGITSGASINFSRWMFGSLRYPRVKMEVVFLVLVLMAVFASLVLMNSTLAAVSLLFFTMGSQIKWPTPELLLDLTVDFSLFVFVCALGGAVIKGAEVCRHFRVLRGAVSWVSAFFVCVMIIGVIVTGALISVHLAWHRVPAAVWWSSNSGEHLLDIWSWWVTPVSFFGLRLWRIVGPLALLVLLLGPNFLVFCWRVLGRVLRPFAGLVPGLPIKAQIIGRLQEHAFRNTTQRPLGAWNNYSLKHLVVGKIEFLYRCCWLLLLIGLIITAITLPTQIIQGRIGAGNAGTSVLSDFRTYLIWGAVIAFGWQARQLFLDFIGDLAVYLSGYRVSQFDETRDKIQQTVLKVARQIYAARDAQGNQRYKKIVMVGHSLGSVIAYDTLNALLNAEATDPVLDVKKRTAAFVTLGSPLDTTAFLFRTQETAEAEVREALAASKQPLILKDAFRAFPWINLYSPWDPVSSRLDYYDSQTVPTGKRVINVEDPDANIAVVAHTLYWQNPLLGGILHNYVRS